MTVITAPITFGFVTLEPDGEAHAWMAPTIEDALGMMMREAPRDALCILSAYKLATEDGWVVYERA